MVWNFGVEFWCGILVWNFGLNARWQILRIEIHDIGEKGFIEASLGPRILRTETAPIAAISIIQYELGDMG